MIFYILCDGQKAETQRKAAYMWWGTALLTIRTFRTGVVCRIRTLLSCTTVGGSRRSCLSYLL